ncbi:MAG: 16S rRNA (cytosine(1402)-N(4))-methyltransferase RsmH [Acidobacteria bacterium]|nr:16S rRNA (cytosine(1402)-N(4))-methyltransferase RsmH [Acidobacteriota bacterium]
MHISVLVSEALEWLAIKPEGIYVDATVGAGGHSRAILQSLTTGRLIGLDKDPSAIEMAQRNLSDFGQKLTLVQRDFAGLLPLLHEMQISGVDGILADLGLSQMQIDNAERGFSFRAAGPLDMRMDPTQPLTAAEIVNHFDERELADLIYEYGEERRSHRIARAIVRARPIRNTVQLAKLIEACLGGRRRKVAPRTIKPIHPATLTFQALRIAVNSELASLVQLLKDSPSCLRGSGRLVIISFHSLEDRLVKQHFQQWDRAGLMRNLTRHVIRPGVPEVGSNPRSRSARLRAAERLVNTNETDPGDQPHSGASM